MTLLHGWPGTIDVFRTRLHLFEFTTLPNKIVIMHLDETNKIFEHRFYIKLTNGESLCEKQCLRAAQIISGRD